MPIAIWSLLLRPGSAHSGWSLLLRSGSAKDGLELPVAVCRATTLGALWMGNFEHFAVSRAADIGCEGGFGV